MSKFKNTPGVLDLWPVVVIASPVMVTSTVVFVVFLSRTAIFPRIPLAVIAPNQLVPFGVPFTFPSVNFGVWVNILTPVPPLTSPGPIINENFVTAPFKTVVSPTPGPEAYTERDAISKADATADEVSWSWARKNHDGIVVRDDQERRVRGSDFNVRSPSDDDLSIAAQITVLHGPMSHSLYGVHYVVALRQECVSKVGSPVHVRGHRVQDRREREQGLHARVPGQLIRRYGPGEIIATQVMVLIRPSGGIRNLIRKCRGGEDLRQQRIRIQSDPRNYSVQLLRRIRWGSLILRNGCDRQQSQ